MIDNGTDEERRDFLTKVGSNLTISEKHLSVTPRKPWQLVVDKGPFAQHDAASKIFDAASFGEKSHYYQPAERGRVETAQIHNLLLDLYLRLKAGDFKDLARLIDVLKLHGFLLSFDGC